MDTQTNRSLIGVLAFSLVFLAVPELACSGGGGGGEVTVVVDGYDRPEYSRGDTVYVEAIRNAEFSLRITNPTPDRVAVALSVDGLNTIDARHSSPRSASKWVLGPYESTTISGWQVSGRSARRFFFTGESRSYGASLGKVENLGVIEAVFYRERGRPIDVWRPEEPRKREGKEKDSARPAPRSEAEGQSSLSDEYAATGMGDKMRHEVERVSIDLDPNPIAKVRIRYEFRPQLVELGILSGSPTPLERRERARGFDSWCPVKD